MGAAFPRKEPEPSIHVALIATLQFMARTFRQLQVREGLPNELQEKKLAYPDFPVRFCLGRLGAAGHGGRRSAAGNR